MARFAKPKKGTVIKRAWCRNCDDSIYFHSLAKEWVHRDTQQLRCGRV